jgi:hypothetical protein
VTFRFDGGRWRRAGRVERNAPIVKARCAFWIDSLFFASYPLGRCELYSEILRVAALLLRFEVPISEIAEIRAEKSFLQDKIVLGLHGVTYQVTLFAASDVITQLDARLKSSRSSKS